MLDDYLTALEASWRGLAAGDTEALVRRSPGHLLSRRPRHPVLSNAVLLDAGDLQEVLAAFSGQPTWTIWSGDEPAGAALAAAGLQRDVVTWPMAAELAAVPPPRPDGPAQVGTVPVARVAAINHVEADLLAGATGLQAWADDEARAGVVLQRSGDDVHVSFVATRASARRQGWATAVLTTALDAARTDGARTATLTSTADGLPLYERLGFRTLGRWQEWVPSAGHGTRGARPSRP